MKVRCRTSYTVWNQFACRILKISLSNREITLRYDKPNTRSPLITTKFTCFRPQVSRFLAKPSLLCRAFRARWHVKCTGLYFSLSLSPFSFTRFFVQPTTRNNDYNWYIVVIPSKIFVISRMKIFQLISSFVLF